jgi:hypothetical protein
MLTNFPAEILDTILTHLVTLFLSGAAGDKAAARKAALRMLAAYNPENERELCLAAQAVSFSLHVLGALGQAADPDLSLSRVLRLRGSAVSLSRASETAQRRLDQCQQTRQEEAACAATRPEPMQSISAQPEPEIEQAPTPPRAVIIAQPATRPYDRAADDARIAASVKRAEAIVAARNAVEAATAQAQAPAGT